MRLPQIVYTNIETLSRSKVPTAEDRILERYCRINSIFMRIGPAMQLVYHFFASISHQNRTLLAKHDLIGRFRPHRVHQTVHLAPQLHFLLGLLVQLRETRLVCRK